MTNKTLKNLISLASLAILFVFTNSALAYVPGIYEPEWNYSYSGSAFTEIPTNYPSYQNVQTATKTIYVKGPTNYVPGPTNTVYVPTSTNTVYVPAPAKTVYVPTSTYSNIGQPANNAVANQNNSNVNTDRYNDNLTASVYNANAGKNSELTALAFNGSGGFMPSSVWQWIIVVFLILIIIIIIRVIIKKPDEIHEHHEVHTTH